MAPIFADSAANGSRLRTRSDGGSGLGPGASVDLPGAPRGSGNHERAVIRRRAVLAPIACWFFMGCSIGAGKQEEFRRGDPKATLDFWQKCGEITQAHDEEVRSI